MARRRKKRIKQVRKARKPLPYFQCPRCGAMTLTIQFKKLDSADEKLAIAKCGTCKLYCELKVPATLDKVDVYNKISDLAYENKLDECMKPYTEETEEGAEEEGEEGEDSNT